MALLGGGRVKLPKRIDLEMACRRMKNAVDRRRPPVFEASFNESLRILKTEESPIGVDHRAGQISNTLDYANRKGFIKAIKYMELKEVVRDTANRRKVDLKSKRPSGFY